MAKLVPNGWPATIRCSCSFHLKRSSAETPFKVDWKSQRLRIAALHDGYDRCGASDPRRQALPNLAICRTFARDFVKGCNVPVSSCAAHVSIIRWNSTSRQKMQPVLLFNMPWKAGLLACNYDWCVNPGWVQWSGKTSGAILRRKFRQTARKLSNVV